jgi:hypothetical protein
MLYQGNKKISEHYNAENYSVHTENGELVAAYELHQEADSQNRHNEGNEAADKQQ